MYEKQNVAGIAFLLCIFLGITSCKFYDDVDNYTYYSGKWKSSTKVERWAGFGNFEYTNKIKINFDKEVVLKILQEKIRIKVSYKNKNDSILAKYRGLKNSERYQIIRYPWEKLSKEEPLFILHKISKNRNALFLEWKGFKSEYKNLDSIWAKHRAIKHPPGATLEGIYLRPTSKKNGNKIVDLKDSVDGKMLSNIMLGRKLDLEMSKREVADKIVTRPERSRMSSMLTYRFKSTDTELRTIGVDYDSKGVSYIQSRPSHARETKRYKRLIKSLGAKKMPSNKVRDEGVDTLLGLTHDDTSYNLLISKGGESIFRVTPKSTTK